MAPSQPAREIKVNVPRLNSTAANRALATEVEKAAKEQNAAVDIRETVDPSSMLALAIESASEWNSLLMTARAERGPQWDVGTQQFMVDEGSELYYDPSPLSPEELKPEPPMQPFMNDPRGSHPHRGVHPPQHHQPQNVYQHYNNPQTSMQGSPMHNMMPNNFSGSPYGNQMPNNQMYGDHSGSPVSMRMGMGGPPPQPQEGRRVTRAMMEDGYPMHGM